MSKDPTIPLSAALALRQRSKTLYTKEGSKAVQGLANEKALNGMAKTYVPLDDEGTRLPEERKKATDNAPELIRNFIASATEAWDTNATVDCGNAELRVDVVFQGNTILKGAPIPFVLYLESEIKDVLGYLRAAKELDPEKDWSTTRSAEGFFSTEGVSTSRVEKDVTHVELAAPQMKDGVWFPGKWAESSTTKNVGTWTIMYTSGALSAREKRELIERGEQILQAIVTARESANSQRVPRMEVTKDILNAWFEPVLS